MFSLIRAALKIAILLSLLTSISAFAKGGFDFLAITGPKLKEPVRVTDTALTRDFFTFANFYEDKTKAPADPGVGYEITRHYIDGKREIIFDRLHYYPETGFVFYDGIENGESEYDGEWYVANPEIKTVFESALSVQVQSAAPAGQQAASSAVQTKADTPSLQTRLITLIGILVSLAGLLIFAFRFRRSPVR